MPFPQNLRRLRLARFLSQAELARQSDLHTVTISRLEAGRVKPSTRTMRALANPLAVTPGNSRHPRKSPRPTKARFTSRPASRRLGGHLCPHLARHLAASAARVIRFPIADPLETALVAATELNREQLEQLRAQVAALLAAMPPPPAPVTEPKPERSPFLVGLPQGPRAGGLIESKPIRHGQKNSWAVSIPAGPCWREPALGDRSSARSRRPRGHER